MTDDGLPWLYSRRLSGSAALGNRQCGRPVATRRPPTASMVLKKRADLPFRHGRGENVKRVGGEALKDKEDEGKFLLTNQFHNRKMTRF